MCIFFDNFRNNIYVYPKSLNLLKVTKDIKTIQVEVYFMENEPFSIKVFFLIKIGLC